MMDRVIDLLQLLALVVAAGLAFWQLRLLRRQQEEEASRLRRGRALEYSVTRAPHLRKLREAVDTAFVPTEWTDEAIPLETVKRAFAEDTHLQADLIALLAHWENLALTVEAKVTDEDMAFEMVASTLVAYVQRFQEFIDDRRKQRDPPRMYTYLLRVASRWRQRLTMRDARPLFSIDV